MSFTIIAETNGDALHPTTYQLIGAASSVGSKSIVICPNGRAASEASEINGVEKVISVVGDCFDIFDGGAWSAALNSACEGKILISASPNGRNHSKPIYIHLVFDRENNARFPFISQF